jgi:hypothetical protein
MLLFTHESTSRFVVKSIGKKKIMEQRTLDILTEDQVRSMSDDELTKARNDIYAEATVCPPDYLRDRVESTKILILMEKRRRWIGRHGELSIA